MGGTLAYVCQSQPPIRIPHTLRWHKITVFNIGTVVHYIGYTHQTQKRNEEEKEMREMRCLLLSGEMNSQVWGVHHPPLQPAYSPPP